MPGVVVAAGVGLLRRNSALPVSVIVIVALGTSARRVMNCAEDASGRNLRDGSAAGEKNEEDRGDESGC